MKLCLSFYYESWDGICFFLCYFSLFFVDVSKIGDKASIFYYVGLWWNCQKWHILTCKTWQVINNAHSVNYVACYFVRVGTCTHLWDVPHAKLTRHTIMGHLLFGGACYVCMIIDKWLATKLKGVQFHVFLSLGL